MPPICMKIKPKGVKKEEDGRTRKNTEEYGRIRRTENEGEKKLNKLFQKKKINQDSQPSV